MNELVNIKRWPILTRMSVGVSAKFALAGL